MGGKARTKRVKCTKPGHPARVLTFTTRGEFTSGMPIYFVHRYNPPEFDVLVGKSEGDALGWLAANGWKVGWFTGK